jgi:hypothetical protein
MSIERLSLSFHAQGESYFPTRVAFPWSEAHDPGIVGTVGRYKGVATPYGSSSYDVPAEIGIENYIAHLHKMIIPVIPEIRSAGATDTWLSAGYFYKDQCNFSFSAEELAMLTDFKTHFNVSCYGSFSDED